MVGNVVLMAALVEHYPELLRNHNIEVGDGLNVSSMKLRVGITYHICIVLQYEPFWYDKHHNHFITDHVSSYINLIKYETIINYIKKNYRTQKKYVVN